MSTRVHGACSMARARGFTFTEVLVVMVIMGLTAGITAAAWDRAMNRTATMQAARLVQKALLEARMRATYRGLNHIVVVDPERHEVALWEDSGSPFGNLDKDDRRIGTTTWPEAVELALPDGSPSLPNPFGGSDVTRAWTLPDADGVAWSGAREGLLATPQGALASVEEKPEIIGSGAMVFSSARGDTVCVGVEGQFGTVHWYRLVGGAWKRG